MCHLTIFYRCGHAERAKPYSCKCNTIELDDMDFARGCDKCRGSPPHCSNIRDEGRRFKNESREEARTRVAKLKHEDESSKEADGDKTPKNDKKTRRWYLETEVEASRKHFKQRVKEIEHEEQKDEQGTYEDEAESGSITPRAESLNRRFF